MRKFIYCILVLSFSSCGLSTSDLYEAYRWHGNEIDVETKMDVKVFGKDTVVHFRDDSYKLLVYVSPIGCTECKFNAYGWKLFLESLKLQKKNVEPWFVVNSYNYRIFEFMCIDNHFDYPIYYDSKGDFGVTNDFNFEKTVTVLLLDSLNNVKIVGNPTAAPGVMKLYKEELGGSLQ